MADVHALKMEIARLEQIIRDREKEIETLRNLLSEYDVEIEAEYETSIVDAEQEDG